MLQSDFLILRLSGDYCKEFCGSSASHRARGANRTDCTIGSGIRIRWRLNGCNRRDVVVVMQSAGPAHASHCQLGRNDIERRQVRCSFAGAESHRLQDALYLTIIQSHGNHCVESS
jgi:hypothetical protein